YKQLNTLDSAKRYAETAFEISEQAAYYGSLMNASDILYKYYESKNDDRLSLYYLKKLMAARDTLENEKSIKDATRLSMQFQFDQEKKTLEFAREKEALLLNQRIARQQSIQYGAFGGILVLSLVIFGFYRGYKSKQRDHLKISEQALELQNKNALLSELSQYKEGLSHMIVHDMKNPLNVIMGLTDGKTPDQENTRLINESAGLILQLAYDIIDIQKFEEAKMQLKSEAYSLKDVVKYASEQVDLIMKMKNMSFVTDIPEHLTASLDLRLISRVLVNLFTNAVKYSPTGSILTIKATDNLAGFFKIEVNDQGQGIADDQLPYIFDKFWQVRAKKSDRTYSAGLGLTFCRLAVEAHRGTITATSQPGEGSVFTITLPIGEPGTSPVEISDSHQMLGTQTPVSYSEAELSTLNEIIGKIADIPIYKAGVIENILEQVESDSEKITDWIKTIKFAILSWDKQRFDELLRLGSDNISKVGSD
ncbi:MAG: HAMP domain-containing sensor histidine kinase, partial [Cyclobacteriaceae bacterium]